MKKGRIIVLALLLCLAIYIIISRRTKALDAETAGDDGVQDTEDQETVYVDAEPSNRVESDYDENGDPAPFLETVYDTTTERTGVFYESQTIRAR